MFFENGKSEREGELKMVLWKFWFFFFFFSFSLKRKIQGRDVIHRDLERGGHDIL